ncbi:MAG TPA: VWA domain-containing protein [Candidatus Hydrogenedentes bacterium]|nr:VWA domain-containing protein [Candidatus Hydrogenedentota bacterium]HOS02376.1 VWA domain-containing protein [Candidatus Hydrogenedentota bacterium]
MMHPFSLFSFSALLHPWFLVLLVVPLLVFLAETTARSAGVLNVSTGDTLARIRGRGRAFMRRLPAILRVAGLVLLIVAMARPVRGLQPRRDSQNVIDIMLCIDVSGSMRAMDFVAQGAQRDRLTVTKDAVCDFIEKRKNRVGDRFGIDRIGLILYAGYAWTQCPLTLDYDVLRREVALASIDDEDPKKNGTAIGSAIGLAASKLRKSEAKSKVVVLLTDGRNNAGELDPITAAQIASDFDVRIYTIGAGTGGEVLIPTRSLFGTVMQPTNLPIDEDTLKKIAAATNGRYFRAADTESLEGAYDEINKLEKSEIQIDDYYEHEDVFAPWAILGGAALAASLFSRRMWFETVP